MEAAGQVHLDSPLGRSIPKNVITRSLGPNAEVMVDLEGPFPVEPGDRYLLCSDGLSGEVEDAEIGMLLGCLPPEQAVRVLVDLANLRGGADNSTVLIVEVLQDFETAARGEAVLVGSPRASLPWPLVATAGVCLLAAGLLAWLELWPLMVITLILFAIAAGFTARQLLVASVAAQREEPVQPRESSRSPYRTFAAAPNEALLSRLAGTVQALREAASEHDWQLQWEAVDRCQAKAEEAQRKQCWGDAIRLQAEAILERMKQLRQQRQGEASGSRVDL